MRGVDGAAAQLRSLVAHAIEREFPTVAASLGGAPPSREALLEVVREFARRQVALAVAWVRVGYVQGNMNSDNCLLSGRTMDYGPFGFIERFEATWAMWIGGGQHFSFMNQPVAAGRVAE